MREAPGSVANRLHWQLLLGATSIAISTAALAADDGFRRNGGFPVENSSFGMALIEGPKGHSASSSSSLIPT